MNSAIMNNKITRLVAAGLLAMLLAVAGSCDSGSGLSQENGDSQPRWR